MSERGIILRASLAVAAAVLAGTGVAAATSHAGWWILAGPATIAVGVVAAARILRRVRPGSALPGVLLGAAILAAGVILAAEDPMSLLTMMPVLGGAAGAVLVADGGRCARKAVPSA